MYPGPAIIMMHPDGRRWTGRTLGRLFQLVLELPGEEPIVRTRRAVRPAEAERLLETAITELRADGFFQHGGGPWPLPEPRAGAVIVAPSAAFASGWIQRAADRAAGDGLLAYEPPYLHRFVLLELSAGLSACYFEVLGYQSRDECAAFEDAFFIMDRFARKVRAELAPPRFLSISDVGFCDDGYAVKAFDERGDAVEDLDAALAAMGCTLRELREGRDRLSDGTVIWNTPRG